MISIHVPREGHDFNQSAELNVLYIFQSTCPARGTTRRHPWGIRNISRFQSTCPARGTTHIVNRPVSVHADFNPRAPRGARPATLQRQLRTSRFQSTCPARGTTVDHVTETKGTPWISIHVPREGHDSKHAQFFRADLRKSYKYPAERDALPTKNVCKHIKTLG